MVTGISRVYLYHEPNPGLSIGYLTSNNELNEGSEVDNMWKKAVSAWFQILFRQFPAGLTKITKPLKICIAGALVKIMVLVIASSGL
jgi:hypothetical protein